MVLPVVISFVCCGVAQSPNDKTRVLGGVTQVVDGYSTTVTSGFILLACHVRSIVCVFDHNILFRSCSMLRDLRFSYTSFPIVIYFVLFALGFSWPLQLDTRVWGQVT